MLICLIHIFLRKYYIDFPNIIQYSISNTHFFDLTYIIFFISSILIYFSGIYSRDISYFILITLMSILIYLEIINKKININKIIIKIMLLAANLQAGLYYLFPSIIGYDAYAHIKIINYLSSLGHMPPIEDSGKYFFSPIFYLYVSIFNNISNLNTKNSLFIAIGLANIVMSLFVYLITKHFINVRAALLSILIFNFINVNIVNDIANITPGSYVLMIFFLMIYTIFIKGKYYYVIIPFLSLIISFTHQLTTFIILLTFIVIYFIKIFYSIFIKLRGLIQINFYYIIFFLVSLYISWNITYVYINISFFDFVFKPFSQMLFSIIKINPSIMTTGKSLENVSYLDYNILQLTYLLFPIISIGGSLLWLRNKDLKKIVISITFLFLFALSYLIPLLGFENFLTDRWTPYIYLFAMPLFSIYFFNLIKRINKNKIRIIFSCAFIFLLIFTSITSPVVNKVNPLIQKNISERNQFTQSEIIPLKYIQNNYNGLITMDISFSDCYSLYGLNVTQFYQNQNTINLFNINLLNTKNVNTKNNLILFRKALLNRPIEIVSNDTVVYGIINKIIYNNFMKKNLVYSNKALLLFIK